MVCRSVDDMVDNLPDLVGRSVDDDMVDNLPDLVGRSVDNI